MIILDGMDNTGKTTLALKLQAALNCNYIHSPGPMDKGPKMIAWALQQIVDPQYAIYDRLSPVTDQVYGPIIRGGTAYLDTTEGKLTVELLRKVPHLIIYTRPTTDKILGFTDGRDQMKGVIENGYKLLNAYDNLINKMLDDRWNIILYNYEEPDSFSEVLEAVKEHINRVPYFKEEYHKRNKRGEYLNE